MSMTYDEQIAWAQDIREQIVEHKLAGGLGQCTDDDLEMLLRATKDHSTIAIAQKRNSIEETNGQSSTDILKQMAEFVALQKNGNPFEAQPSEGIVRKPLEDVPIEILGEHSLAPGEGHQGVVNETVEEFNKRMAPIMAEKED